MKNRMLHIATRFFKRPCFYFVAIFSIPVLFAMVTVSSDASAKKIRQTHKVFKQDKKSATDSSAVILLHDSIELALYVDSLRFSGYDKPLTASKETFLITNSSKTDIKKVGIRITYLDLKNRMLHSREATVSAEVPANETRIVSIPSWDTQHSYFYYLGQEPKRVATPYKVKIDLLWIEILS